MNDQGSCYRPVNIQGNKVSYRGTCRESPEKEVKRLQKRFLHKDGSCNVYFKHIFGE